MKLTVLLGNNVFPSWYSEWGLSFYIEEGSTKILFDLSSSDLFIRNALQLKCDLSKLDYLVISHGHWDHSWGMRPLIEMYEYAKTESKNTLPQLIAHPSAFAATMRPKEFNVGPLVTQDDLNQNFSLTLTKAPFWLTEKLVFLGEIEKKCDFEYNSPNVKLSSDNIVNDNLSDDSALAYKSDNGLVIITGLSHSGICNIVEYARKVCNEERICDIIGGFHLLSPSALQLQETTNYFKKIQPLSVHACHCTDPNAKFILSRAINMKDFGVSLKLAYE
jgi:7,8-dihydropterin-6-yl-methyl-4-(beta-D-ribofuranosyl)aminobenzene 5'-phosphate synthase